MINSYSHYQMVWYTCKLNIYSKAEGNYQNDFRAMHTHARRIYTPRVAT